MITVKNIRNAARQCLIKAGTTYREDQFKLFEKAIGSETSANARWVLQQALENARIAQREQLPLCDDTGIPHVIASVGESCSLPAGWLTAIHEGIAKGLMEMPGRPMAVRGNDIQRVEQSCGLYADPAAVELAPVIVQSCKGGQLELTVLLLGGGPEIRARTKRVFHRRSIHHVADEAASWLSEEISSLGCTPSVLVVGIGRSQVEASALMLQAMAEGRLDEQSELEKRITDRVNQSRVGPLGLGGSVTALGCFLKIGPARASGVRIVSARPCCLVEPRRASIRLR